MCFSQPANLFRRGNKYKIGDLGVARPLSWRSRQVDEGDGRYLAKELLADEIGHLTKADIFSLGISLYELARGRRLPTTGEEYAALRRGDIPDLPTLSPRFNTVLLRMMHVRSAACLACPEFFALMIGVVLCPSRTLNAVLLLDKC